MKRSYGLLSPTMIGVYGTILGCLLSTGYIFVQDKMKAVEKSAVSDYKIQQFDPQEFTRMRMSIEQMQGDIKEIKDILKRRPEVFTVK